MSENSRLFKIGDVVVLKSGGSAMVVTAIECDLATCDWFFECRHFSQRFPASCLVFYYTSVPGGREVEPTPDAGA